MALIYPSTKSYLCIHFNYLPKIGSNDYSWQKFSWRNITSPMIYVWKINPENMLNSTGIAILTMSIVMVFSDKTDVP